MPKSDDFDFQSFGSLMGAPNKLDYPDWVLKLIDQTTGWFARRFVLSDGYEATYAEALHDEPALMFESLDWVHRYAELLPCEDQPRSQKEALVLWFGETDLDGAMRTALDYALLFSKRQCRRVWVVTDCWIPCDIMPYGEHLDALARQDVTLRFLVVTPWGWLELPLDESWTTGRLSLFDSAGRK